MNTLTVVSRQESEPTRESRSSRDGTTLVLVSLGLLGATFLLFNLWGFAALFPGSPFSDLDDLIPGWFRELLDCFIAIALLVVIGRYGITRRRLSHQTVELDATRQHLVRETTERQSAEETARRAAREFQAFFEESPSGAFITRPSGEIVACNRAFAAMFDLGSPADAHGFSVIALYRQPAVRDLLLATLRQKRSVIAFDADMVTATGKLLSASITVAGQFANDGTLTQIRGFVVDVTEQRLFQEKLQQSSRVEAVGQVAAGVAHDFNNMLTAIVGNAELLQFGLPDDQELSLELVDEIMKAATRSSALIRRLMALVRHDDIDIEVIDVNELITEMQRMIRLVGGDRISYEFRVGDQPLLTRANTGLIEAVILNLVSNARDAMTANGRLTITVDSGDVSSACSPSAKVSRPVRPQGRFVEIAVRDTGSGMSEDVLEHLFQPFYTTKQRGKGTGLGISSASSTVEQFGGWIEIDSLLGVGTEVRVFLPLTSQADAKLVDSRVDTKLRAIEGSILIVDNDEQICALLQKILERNGFNVYTALDVEMAVSQAAELGETLSCLITDTMLRGCSGIELVDRIHSIVPRLPVIFISSEFSTGTSQEILLRRNESPVLPRPISTPQLLEAVATATGRLRTAA